MAISKGSAFQAMKASLTLGKITAHPKSGKILATSCNKFIQIPTALFGPRPMRQKLSLWEDAYMRERIRRCPASMTLGNWGPHGDFFCLDKESCGWGVEDNWMRATLDTLSTNLP